MLQLVTVPIAVGIDAARHPRHAQRRLPARRCARGAAEGDHRQRHRVRHGRPDPGGTLPREQSARSAAACASAALATCCSATRSTWRCRCPLDAPADGSAGGRRAGGADPALAHRAAAVAAAIHTELAVTAVVAVLLATLLSFAVARTITRPLAAITGVMREVAATGDLTRKIVLRRGSRWDDEDARLLATTFNTLTDSIARFQREMSQKERLSSLGRLSTVIAHEVRNPLMIIKAALHTLRQPDVGAGGAARGGRRHRRRGRAPEPHRQRGARLRAADPVRAGAGRPQRALPRVGGRGAGVGAGRAGRRSTSTRRVADDRRPTPSGCASRWST